MARGPRAQSLLRLDAVCPGPGAVRPGSRPLRTTADSGRVKSDCTRLQSRRGSKTGIAALCFMASRDRTKVLRHCTFGAPQKTPRAHSQASGVFLNQQQSGQGRAYQAKRSTYWWYCAENSCTALIKAPACSGLTSGVIPWPRLNTCPEPLP